MVVAVVVVAAKESERECVCVCVCVYVCVHVCVCVCVYTHGNERSLVSKECQESERKCIIICTYSTFISLRWNIHTFSWRSTSGTFTGLHPSFCFYVLSSTNDKSQKGLRKALIVTIISLFSFAIQPALAYLLVLMTADDAQTQFQTPSICCG